MKKLVAIATFALLSSSVSAFAACGSNASRTSTTRAPASGTPGTGTAGTATGAGMGPTTALPR